MMRWTFAILVLGCASEPPSVAAVALTVSDLDAAASWFESTLGARRDSSTDASVALSLGAEHVTLRSSYRGSPADPPARGDDLQFQHLALVVDDMDEAFAVVGASGAHAISPEPQQIPRTNVTAAGIRAFYFHGPDGHPLELIWYPPSKGRPAWHAQSDDRVLGIDHTAITVSDTDNSLAFYSDVIGLPVVGESFNEGIEQERLSGVDGARVRITSLRGTSGMGIELLEYVAPVRARKRPDPHVDDPRYAETTIVVSDLALTRQKSIDAGMQILSCETCEREVVVLDPDAHAIRLVE